MRNHGFLHHIWMGLYILSIGLIDQRWLTSDMLEYESQPSSLTPTKRSSNAIAATKDSWPNTKMK